MSKLQVNEIVDKEGTGSPTFTNGVVVSGVGTFSSQVSIAGTLTYEDVTNVDAVGVVTARTGIKVLAGGANIVGVTTSTLGANVTAGGINVTAGGITVQAGIATLPANSTIGGKVPATTGKAIAMAMVFGYIKLRRLLKHGSLKYCKRRNHLRYNDW